MTKLTHKEIVWLRSRGDRRESDVFVDAEGGKYVMMGDGAGGEKPVYLLTDSDN